MYVYCIQIYRNVYIVCLLYLVLCIAILFYFLFKYLFICFENFYKSYYFHKMGHFGPLKLNLIILYSIFKYSMYIYKLNN